MIIAQRVGSLNTISKQGLRHFWGYRKLSKPQFERPVSQQRVQVRLRYRRSHIGPWQGRYLFIDRPASQASRL